MEIKPQPIYCDESGMTGPQLLDSDQEYFSYASIAIDAGVAQECVERITKDYRVQGKELKAKNLLGYNRGRQAISDILECHHENLLVSVYHKKYSLACKLFEYIFEPPLAQASGLFYGVGFHKFIAALLFTHLRASARYADVIFSDFQTMMRENALAPSLFSAIDFPSMGPALELIKAFCRLNRESILEELNAVHASGIGKWVLDLTETALFCHLGTWGMKFDQLDVYCDKINLTSRFHGLLNTMIGRRERLYNSFFGESQPIAFNLARDISLVEDSAHHPGIQLADVAAGTIIYMLQNPADRHVEQWRRYLPQLLRTQSVLPNTEDINVSSLAARRNFAILCELVERSRRRESLSDGMEGYIYRVTRHLEEHGSLETFHRLKIG